MKVIILVFMTFFLIGCYKRASRTTEISGIVLDFGTKEPIEGAKIHLKDGFAKSVEYTDSEGNFDIELKGEHFVFLYPSHLKYWGYDDGRTAVTDAANGYKKGSKTTGEIIELKAKAWFAAKIDSDIHVDSAKFKPVREDLSISRRNNINLFGEGPHNLITISPGKSITGNTYYRYQIEYKDTEGKWNSFIDSVYIKKGEVYTGTLKY